MWKKRLIQGLWITASVGVLVLLVAAMKLKTHKHCKSVNIEMVGEVKDMFIDEADVEDILNTEGDVLKRDISSIDLRKLEERLEKNPWVKNAELFFDNNQVLNVQIEEREPIARVFTVMGNSFYLDTSGFRLPLSHKVSARVPVVTNFTNDKRVMGHSDSVLLKDVVKIGSYILADSFWMAQTAQVDIMSDGTFELIPVMGSHSILIGDAENLEEKFTRLFTFYKQAWVQNGINKYEKLDVRFNNQIVATKRGYVKMASDTNRVAAILHGLSTDVTDSLKAPAPVIRSNANRRDSVRNNNRQPRVINNARHK